MLIWADSHGRAFKEGLEQAAYDAGVPAVIIWTAGCPPLLGLAKEENTSTRIQNEACAEKNRVIEKAFGALPGVETLLIIGRWSYYAEGRGLGADESNTIRLFASQGSPVSGKDQAELLTSAWGHSATVMEPHFSNIFVLRQPPEIRDYDSRIVSRKLAHGHLRSAADIAAITSVSREDAEARAASGERAMQGVIGQGRFRLIDSWPAFCSDESCSAMRDGKAGYFDNNHVTNTTAIQVRNLFAPVFEAAR